MTLNKQFSGLCSHTSTDRELITYEVGDARQFIWVSLEAPKAQLQASLKVNVTNTLALLLLEVAWQIENTECLTP